MATALAPNIIAFLPVAILLAGAAAQSLLARVLSGAAKGWLAVGFGLASLASVAALWAATYPGGVIEASLGSYDGPMAFAYHIDALSLLFAFMGTGIGSLVLIYSAAYMSHDVSATRFFILMQLFIAGLVNLVFSADLLLLYASWELVGVCSYLLVGFWYGRDDAAAGARKVLVMTHVAGYALLAAILTLMVRTGATAWTDPRITAAFTGTIFALMFVAAMAKSVQFPLNTWIPSAMAAPSPVSSLLHSACYVTAGVYLVARMHSMGVWPVGWSIVVVWVGTITAVVGILFAMVQSDLKRLLAFSTVSQIGYMMLGLGLGTPLGIIAGLLHLLNHGFFKGGLFLLAGGVQRATETRDMEKLGGLKNRMPVTTLLWLVFAASISGVPLFNGFVSKWLIYVAALQANFVAPALIAWFVSIMTMFVMLKATTSVFFGEESEASAGATESPRPMLAGSGVLAGLCVLLGIAPQLAIVPLIAPTLFGMGMQSDLVAGWLTVVTPGSSFSATVGLVLAIASLLVGGSTYWLFVARKRGAASTSTLAGAATGAAAPAVSLAGPGMPALLGSLGPAPLAFAPVPHLSTAAASETFSGGLPLPAGGQMRAHDFSVRIERGLAPFFTYGDPDRYWFGLYRVVLALASIGGQTSVWLEAHSIRMLLLLAAAIAVIGGAFSGVVRTAASLPPVELSWVPLFVAMAVSLTALLLSMGVREVTRRRVWFAIPAGLLVLAGLLADVELIRLALVECAAFLAVVVLVASGVDRHTRNAYLIAATIAAVAQVSGVLLYQTAPAGVVLALLLVGFSVKLALVPAYIWLPQVAEKTPAPVIGLILAVIDIVAFAELVQVRQAAPWLFTPAWPWMILAVLSVVGGGLLALGSKHVKRMLALSTVVGAGFVVTAVTLGGPVGVEGAVMAAVGESLGVALLFASVASVESHGILGLGESAGVARHRPLAAAGFVLGMFTVLGLPFTAGFSGHWRIYETALAAGPAYLAVLLIGTVLLVLSYSRVVARVWWGGTERHEPVEAVWGEEPLPLAASVVLLAVAVLVIGVAPWIM